MSLRKSSTLICMALKAEAQLFLYDSEFTLVLTGMGKLNSALELQSFLNKHPNKFTHILNLGTAGSKAFPQGTLVEVQGLIDRDVDLSLAGGNKGYLPKQQPLASIKTFTNLPKGVCGSGDHLEQLPAKNTCDLVDMEAFALAYVCQKQNLNFHAIKYITDSSDNNLLKDWKSELIKASQSLYQFACDNML